MTNIAQVAIRLRSLLPDWAQSGNLVPYDFIFCTMISYFALWYHSLHQDIIVCQCTIIYIHTYIHTYIHIYDSSIGKNDVLELLSSTFARDVNARVLKMWARRDVSNEYSKDLNWESPPPQSFAQFLQTPLSFSTHDISKFMLLHETRCSV